MNKLERAQQAVVEAPELDGWLLYDFRHSNPLFWELLEIDVHSTRRVFLYVPPSAPGGGQAPALQDTPVLLVHQVDAGHLRRPGLTVVPYQNGEELLVQLRSVLGPAKRVAMEYSPMAALPTLSYVDGGTLELVRSLGIEVVPSAELAQAALCRLEPEDLASHERAASRLGVVVEEAFAFIGREIDRGVDEWTVAEQIRGQFVAAGLETDSGPIVAVNGHAGDPHYQPGPSGSTPIRRGDWVLIDLWAKEPGGTYGDITWTAFAGDSPSEQQRTVFDLVTGARDAAVEFLRRETAGGRYPEGWQVDQAARQHIERAGQGAHFTHRLGHSLGAMVHGHGANLDGYETHDTRRLVPGLAFTIEPGVYLPDFGVRSEINLYMEEGGPRITSDVQREIVLIK